MKQADVSQVSVENVHQYSVIAESVEYVILALTRYKIVERLYLKRSNEPNTRLRYELTELYTCILRFLINAQRFYGKSAARKPFFQIICRKPTVSG